MAFKKRELTKYKKLLLEKRDEMIKFIDEGKSYSRTEQENPADSIDQAAQTSERILHLRLIDKQSKLLKEIEKALKRIEDGTYGYCEGTGEEIERKRLELRPWARYSIEYKEEMERREKNTKYMR